MLQEFEKYEQCVASLSPSFIILIAIMAVWSLIWKGIALWRAADIRSKPWFVILLIVNTVGILEIIYIFFISKKKSQQLNS